MTLHLCIDCATIYDCPLGCELTCPHCGQSLELREQLREQSESFATIASWALFGLPEKRRKLWEVY